MKGMKDMEDPKNDAVVSITRRDLFKLVGGAGLSAAMMAIPGIARAASSGKKVLVIGIDISDTMTLDPARQAQYTAPMTLVATYDPPVTMVPGNYTEVKPNLAESWERTSDGQGWRMKFRKDVKFASGNPMTMDDVKWSFDRVMALKDQPSLYLHNIKEVRIVDDHTLDVILVDPEVQVLNLIASPSWVVYERAVLEKHGGTNTADDKATTWLNGHSCGTGAYSLAAWERNVQIQLTKNPHYWGGMPAFERIVIRHIPDSAAQLLAVQRGDIDVAFNLLPEQWGIVKKDQKLRLEQLPSLDFIYIAVTHNAEFNKALAIKEARQAIGYAIDYDGIIKTLLGGAAQRPASFLPVGVLGSTPEIAKEIGFHEDLPHARELLKKANLPDGFEFQLTYGKATVAGISYDILAQKLQSDLARVGIKAKLDPIDQVNLRTNYTAGKLSSVITFWNPPAVINDLWAEATVKRVAKRIHWTPPKDLTDLVKAAEIERDRKKQADLWVEYQKRMVDDAGLIVLFQPIYQIAVSNGIKAFPLTAAGWQANLSQAHP